MHINVMLAVTIKGEMVMRLKESKDIYMGGHLLVSRCGLDSAVNSKEGIVKILACLEIFSTHKLFHYFVYMCVCVFQLALFLLY